MDEYDSSIQNKVYWLNTYGNVTKNDWALFQWYAYFKLCKRSNKIMHVYYSKVLQSCLCKLCQQTKDVTMNLVWNYYRL